MFLYPRRHLCGVWQHECSYVANDLTNESNAFLLFPLLSLHPETEVPNVRPCTYNIYSVYNLSDRIVTTFPHHLDIGLHT